MVLEYNSVGDAVAERDILQDLVGGRDHGALPIYID
jgi:hypothetical protein